MMQPFIGIDLALFQATIETIIDSHRRHIFYSDSMDKGYIDTQLACDICVAICAFPIFSKLTKVKAVPIIDQLQRISRPLDLLETQALAPLAWFRLREYLPEDLAKGLKLLAWRHQHANSVRIQMLDGVLQALKRSACRPVLLKGAAALARGVYPNKAWRPMRDVDIFIDVERCHQAERVLRSEGFYFESPNRTSVYPYHHHMPNAIRRDRGVTLSIELHHRLVAFDGRPLLASSKLYEHTLNAELNGTPCRVFDDEVSLMHLWRHQLGQTYMPRFPGYLDAVLIALSVSDLDFWTDYERRYPAVVNYVRMLFREFDLHAPPFSKKIHQSACSFGHGLPTFREAWFGRWELKKALLRPSDWWLHAFYGIPEGHPVRHLLYFRHPVNLWMRVMDKLRVFFISFFVDRSYLFKKNDVGSKV